MSKDTRAALQTAAHDDGTDLDHLDDRDRRALTEHISVCPDVGEARGAPGLFVVVGEHGGGEYLVDTHEGACTCPDAEYNLPDGDRETCKHVAAARFATGRREIPAGVAPEAVREDLADHVDASPRFAGEATTDPAPAYTAGDASELATDGGTVLEQDVDADADEDGGARPDDCQCHPSWRDDAIPCFACWLEGFDTPNPDAPVDSDSAGDGQEATDG
jgi:predicted nucleic acid-binding Zn finger protein